MNNVKAKILAKKQIYRGSVNVPTTRTEYACPCGKGRIIEQTVKGFDDLSVKIACPECEKKYDVVFGKNHRWELVARSDE